MNENHSGHTRMGISRSGTDAGQITMATEKTSSPHDKSDLKKILVVEDDDAHIELIKRGFSPCQNSIQLVFVKSLAGARIEITRHIPDLILADWLLPDGRGAELVGIEVEGQKVPVVIMTSHGNEQIAVDVMKSGAIDYLIKSGIMFSELPHITERALQQWRMMQDKIRMEKDLFDNQQKLELSLQAASAGVWSHEIKKGTIYWSKEYASLLGYPDMEASPSREFWVNCIHPEDRDVIFRVIHFPLETPETEINIEYRIVLPDGRIRWLNDRGRMFSDAKGRPVKVLGISIDITEMKHLEELKVRALSQIEKNLEQLASLTDQIRNPLSVIVVLAERSGGKESREIIDQAMEIDMIVRKLDYGWAESEKVREFLKKHYHMFDTQ